MAGGAYDGLVPTMAMAMRRPKKSVWPTTLDCGEVDAVPKSCCAPPSAPTWKSIVLCEDKPSAWMSICSRSLVLTGCDQSWPGMCTVQDVAKLYSMSWSGFSVRAMVHQRRCAEESLVRSEPSHSRGGEVSPLIASMRHCSPLSTVSPPCHSIGDGPMAWGEAP